MFSPSLGEGFGSCAENGGGRAGYALVAIDTYCAHVVCLCCAAQQD